MTGLGYIVVLCHCDLSVENDFMNSSKCITELFYILQPPLLYKVTSLILLPFACDTAYQSRGFLHILTAPRVY